LQNITDMEVGYTMSQAIAEASRCLLCHDPPCTKGCPAGTDPGKFIWKLRMRNVKGAIRTIKQNNILGGACGVACPVDELCQKACSATEIDRPIEIGKLQRFLVEHGWRIGFDPLQKGPARDARVAIIGSGPAGLACAAELARAGIGATIFEARPEPGGVLRYGVPRFRLHEEFLERELEDVRKLGVEIKCNSRIKPKEADKLLKKGFAAVFIATGIWAPYRLPLPGAQLKNVTTATELLEAARQRGAAVKKMVERKNVAIIGGGSVAMDVANTCKGLGADRVYCICLEGPAEIPADRTDLAMALANFVVIKPHAQLTEILGKGGKVVEVRGNETEWIKPGSLAPQNARAVPGTKFQLRVDVVVFAIGSGPERENLQLATSVKHKKNGLIQTKKDGVSTSDGKVLAGGDVARGPALIVHAVADGKEAARKIIGTLAGSEGSHD
jgi:NADPH-dependent glutamate synthase beta subunit-like oxidoreductase